jgi:hypothetical protein
MRTANSQRIQASRSRRPGRAPLLALALTVVALVSLAAASAAPAARSQSTLFDLGGAGLNLDAPGRAKALDELQGFGVDTVRVIVTWRQIAPDVNAANKPAFDATDPAAYPAANWTPLDDLVRGAKLRGMNVLLTPSSPVPNWGSKTHDSISEPSTFDFQQFVQALGTRYSGSYTPPPPLPTDPQPPTLPRVDDWSVWNEPNLTLFLKPQLRHGVSVAAKSYRELFLAAQRGLETTGHGGDLLLIGEISPSSGRGGTDPITFLRGVFCLNAKFKRQGGCSPIDADGWAQHPYDPFDAPFEEGTHNLINLATIGELSGALNKAKKAGAVRRRLPIYVTEYGVESVPDRRYGVSQLQQAEFISISEYLMYLNRRIRTFGQYLLQDDKGNSQINFQTGLRFDTGSEKLSYDAFKIALVAQRRNADQRQVTIWGHVRPKGAPYTVTVKARGPGAEHTIKTIQTNGAGYFQFRTPFTKGRRYSAETRLQDGTELSGPFVRVYVFK